MSVIVVNRRASRTDQGRSAVLRDRRVVRTDNCGATVQRDVLAKQAEHRAIIGCQLLLLGPDATGLGEHMRPPWN
ncbi:MAG: hypothetical protein WBV61_00375 [Rhodanobacteraceae bacterium]